MWRGRKEALADVHWLLEKHGALGSWLLRLWEHEIEASAADYAQRIAVMLGKMEESKV